MHVTIFAHPLEKATSTLSTITKLRLEEGISSVDKNEETTIAQFKILNEKITEEQFMKCVEDTQWDKPEHVYVVIKNNSYDGINSFKGNQKNEFTRVFRNNIVVNMFT